MKLIIALILILSLLGCGGVAGGGSSTASPTPNPNPSPNPTPNPTPNPNPTPTDPFSGDGAVSAWKAYSVFDTTDQTWHQGILITNHGAAQILHAWAYNTADCTGDYRDHFNDVWAPLRNGIWWYTHHPELLHVQWIWIDSNGTVLQQTACIDYTNAPKWPQPES